MRTDRRWVLVLAIGFSLALLMGLGNWRLAYSQAVTLVAKQVAAGVGADDPMAEAWQKTTPVEVPLTPQRSTPPQGGSVPKVTTRALHDEKQLYVLVEWDDATQDTNTQAPQGFRDAAAVQFPVTKGDRLPFFCMGQMANTVNIWHWKADWQLAIDKAPLGLADQYPGMHVDLYPLREGPTFFAGRAAGNILSQKERASSVENLVAGGFGTLTTASTQDVQGKAVWKDGHWRVVFTRALSDGKSEYTQFEPGTTTAIAFAVWDGAKEERDGMKSVSQFINLQLEGTTLIGLSPTSWGIIIALVVIVFGSLGFLVWRQRRPVSD